MLLKLNLVAPRITLLFENLMPARLGSVSLQNAMSQLGSSPGSSARESSQELGLPPDAMDMAMRLERYEAYICALSDAIVSMEDEPNNDSIALLWYFQDAIVRYRFNSLAHINVLARCRHDSRR